MKRLVLVLTMAFLALPAVAQIGANPNVERGFEPGKAYAFDDIDSVNLFNGNLSVQIPIGPRYPVSEKLSWGLTLVYNSKLWDFEEVYDAGSGETLTRAIPGRDFNAGLGWRLSPGELDLSGASLHTYVYVSPTGSRHVFSDRLHGNSPATPGVYYTADGTYLRYHVLDRTIEFPDGTIHRFNGEGKLTAIHDRYWVDSNSNGVPQFGEPGGWVRASIGSTNWLFTDSHNRNVTVLLANGVVTSVTVPGIGGANETWTLGTSNATPIARVCPHNVDTSPASVRFLQTVTSPGSLAAYQMVEYDQPTHQPGQCNETSGVLRKLRLPTQGVLEWDYGYYRRPDGTGGIQFCRAAFANSVGVVARRKSQPAAWGPTETQLFTSELEGATLPCFNGQPNVNVKEARTRVKQLTGGGTTPPGDETIHYFSVSIENIPGSWQEGEFGLPFSRLTTDGAGRFLSRRLVPEGATIALQESYVRYETDGDTGGNSGSNPRIASERTLWPIQNPNPDSPPATYADVNRGDFDGLGHYRTETTGGNFDAANVRTTTTRWNPTRGTYPGSFTLPGVGEPWVLETYNESIVTEGSDTDKSQFCFDPDKGALLRQRVLEGTVVGVRDLLSVFVRDGSGQVTRAETYGGDLQTIDANPSTGLCSIPLPANPYYRTDYTYAAGVLATAEPKSAVGASIGYTTVNRTIDSSTGLVTFDTDPTGITTSYGYDALHRRTLAVPPATEDAWVSHVYVAATTANKARLSIVAKTHGTTPVTLTKEDFYFDGFGRLVEERRLLPGSVTTKRFTSYDLAGNLASQSVWSTAPAPPTTRYQQYDALGRPGRRIFPDGKTEFLFYDGVKGRSRQYKVGTAWGSGQIVESDVGAGETFDRQGRLWKVHEPKLTSASGSETTQYTYDAAGRLVRVEQGSQVRTFSYDGRGFLIAESHPELGILAGGGAITYSRYDARGNLGRQVDGPWTLETTYDLFGRPTKVEEILPGSGRRLWKERSYGSGQGPADRSAGKVVTEKRHNWVVPPWSTTESHVIVTESWSFAGRGGRASARTTAIDAGAQSYAQTFSWDELGNLASETYPVCQHATCTGSGAATVRSQSYTFAQGVLTSVPGFGSLGYHPNGMVASVVHTNGVTDSIAVDGSGLPRPGSIATSGAIGTNWDSGAYTYDGAGNLVKMGADYFLYDARSRVTLGRIGDGGLEKKQSYGFDRYGNVLTVTTQVGAGSPLTRTNATVPTTNRLSAAFYDTAGNTTSYGGQSYTYDPFHRIQVAPGNRVWVYGPGDERIWTITYTTPGDPFSLTEVYFLRGLDKQVRREYFEIGGNAIGKWSVGKDYVYRDGQLLAAFVPSIDRTLHYSLDHLGTPRLVTDQDGNSLSLHHYYPFGEEATNPNQSAERMRFTGHERDQLAAGTTDDLDFMHARWHSPITGRFLSVDPAGGQAFVDPQRWNRYSYVANSPLIFVDPDGRELEAFYLATGPWYNWTRHSAIYFRDATAGSETDIVFSHGGAALDVGTYSQYLASYDAAKDPTIAYRLALTEPQAKRLLARFMADFEFHEKSGRLNNPDYSYGYISNNCAQYVCDRLIGELRWDPEYQAWVQVYEVVDTFSPPTNPVITMTNDALLVLRLLGVLKGVEEPSPVRGAPQNVVVYWQYNAAKK